MHVAAGFGVGFGLFVVEDLLQDSFQESERMESLELTS